MSHKSLRLTILVSGRGTNLQALIDACKSGILRSKISLVVSNLPNVQALDRAQRAGIPTAVVSSRGVDKDEFQNNLLKTVMDAKPNLVVLAGFMKILSKEFVHRFKDHIINIHPALLPRFPGLHAVRQAIEARVKTSGCTVHIVDEGCDSGSVLIQKKVPVLKDDTEETLAARILEQEHKAIVEAIMMFETKN